MMDTLSSVHLFNASVSNLACVCLVGSGRLDIAAVSGSDLILVVLQYWCCFVVMLIMTLVMMMLMTAACAVG
jgi:hypothetical protein